MIYIKSTLVGFVTFFVATIVYIVWLVSTLSRKYPPPPGGEVSFDVSSRSQPPIVPRWRRSRLGFIGSLRPPMKARKSRLDTYAMNTVPVEFKVPMVVEQHTEMTEKLAVALSAQKENMKNLTLRISWGRLQLMTPIQVALEY